MRALLCALLLATVVGCNGSSQIQTDPPVPKAESQEAEYTIPAAGQTDPDAFRVKFETTKGDFLVEVLPGWAPLGAARFRELVESGFYDGCGVFRVVPDFMVQFGINGDPAVQAMWQYERIEDDPVKQSNERGTITFATSGPNSRTAQVFINFKANSFLDGQGFSPFGRIIEGMEVVDSINSQYLELPNQGRIQAEGNEYLRRSFPNLDYVTKATIVD